MISLRRIFSLITLGMIPLLPIVYQDRSATIPQPLPDFDILPLLAGSNIMIWPNDIPLETFSFQCRGKSPAFNQAIAEEGFARALSQVWAETSGTLDAKIMGPYVAARLQQFCSNPDDPLYGASFSNLVITFKTPAEPKTAAPPTPAKRYEM